MNIFDTRVLDEVVRQMPSRGGFIRDTFFTRRLPILGKKADVDFYKGSRRISPFVNEKSSAKTVSKIGYKTDTFETPLLKPKDVTTVENLSIRMAGEQYGGSMTREQRGLMMVTETIQNFNDMNIRREEWMAATAMFTGKIPVIGEGVNYEIDFGFGNKAVLSGTDLWSDKTNSDPLANLNTWIEACQKKGYKTPNVMVGDTTAIQAFINHPKVQAVLDVRNIDLAIIKPSMLDDNVSYIGTLGEQNISIYKYNEWYIDDWTDPTNPVEKSLVPAGTIMLGSTRAKATIYYGEITIVDDTVDGNFRSYVAEKAAQTWVTRDPDARFLALHSRPLTVPHEVDSWYVAKVL